jgi:hypothetical protein
MDVAFGSRPVMSALQRRARRPLSGSLDSARPAEMGGKRKFTRRRKNLEWTNRYLKCQHQLVEEI